MAEEDVGELLAKVTASLPNGGEERPGQVQMARAVASAISTGRHLVVQAGTGTGKSLAYLVPAVVSGERVVVATATKALQDQLASHDLPALSRALGREVRFSVLKGRSNYLCLQQAAEVGGRGAQQHLGAAETGDDEPDPEGAGALADQVRQLLEWSAHTGTGDRADLPFEPHQRAWAMVSVGPRECPGARRCPEGWRCFAERARANAEAADVVVVNTHLYGAHLASGGALLPPHAVAVFDEAHEMEAVMTESLGVDVAPGRLLALRAMARPLLGSDDSAAADVESVAHQLRSVLAPLAGERVLRRGGGPDGPDGNGVDGRGPDGNGVDGRGPPEGHGPHERDLFGLGGGMGPVRLADPDAALAGVLELARVRVERLRGRLLAAEGSGGEGESEGDGTATRRARAAVAAGHLQADLQRFAVPGPDDVAWVDGGGRAPVLRLSPIDVGPALAASLWGTVTAVLTSATVPAHIAGRLGLDDFDVDHLDVGSPFDFRSHALLYVARHLPDPRREGAAASIWAELETLIAAAGGRTLALFTSRSATAAAAEALAPRLPFQLLVQGQLPKGRLLEAFGAEETSCLFATLGFWQGVDVPGRALSLVTLDRLPFGRPDDPVLQARRERAGRDAFSLVDLPRAATLLAQGVGRLIRSTTDRGVVAVLDPRLATAAYRRVLLDALPPMRRTVDPGTVAAFLADALGSALGDAHCEKATP